MVLLLYWRAGGRSAQIDARANRWDAQEYESLKAERERLKREIDVSAHCDTAQQQPASYLISLAAVAATTSWSYGMQESMLHQVYAT
jgi:hypothetical protein